MVFSGARVRFDGMQRITAAPVISSWAYESLLHAENDAHNWASQSQPLQIPLDQPFGQKTIETAEQQLAIREKLKANAVDSHFPKDSQFDEATDISVMSGMVLALMAIVGTVLRARYDSN
jgi:hypothetical protein